MACYCIESRTKKYFKGYGIWSFRRNVSSKYGGQLLIAAAKAGLNTLKTVTKTVAHKADEATGEFIGNIVDKIKTCTWYEWKKFARNNYSTRAKRRNIKQVKTSIIRWNITKYQGY